MPDVRAAGDRHVPALAKAVHAAIQRVRDSVTLRDAEEAAEHQTYERLVDWSGFWTLTKSAPKDAETVIYEAIVAGAKADGRFTAQLGLVNKAAVDMARRQAALLVVGLSRESMAAVNHAVVVATSGGMTVSQLARTIRDSVGLSTNFAGAVANYRLSLEAEGGFSAASRFTLAPRGPSGSLSVERIDAAVARYSERLVASRATIIARTESLRASHAGQKALWSQARDEGLIPPDTKRIWQTTDDDRLCPECAALDGAVVEFDGEFSIERGNATLTEETPPIHPGCRCTESLDV